MPAALLELTRRAPEIIIQNEVDRSRPLVEGRHQARFDMVLSRVREASLEPDLVETLLAEPIRVYARDGHPLARKHCGRGGLSVLSVDLGVRAEKVGLITRRHHEPSPALRQALDVFGEVAHRTFADGAEASGAAQVKAHARH